MNVEVATLWGSDALAFSLATLGTVVLLAAVFRILASPRRKAGKGAWNPLGWLRLTFSAAAFFVPMAMTGTCLVFLESMANTVGGQNPWVARSDTDRTIAAISCLVVAAGVAGQVGLLQAWRAGQRPGPDDFMRGIRQHTLTFLLVKLAWAAAVSNLPLPYSPYFDTGSRSRGPLSRYGVLLIPSFFAAGVLASASGSPYRPFRAIVHGVRTSMQHPLAIGIPLAIQTGIMIAAMEIARSNTAMTFAMANASPIGFQLFTYGIYHDLDDPTIVIAIMNGLTAPVMITAYWSITAGITQPFANAATRVATSAQPSP